MSSDAYTRQNIYRYSRRTYKDPNNSLIGPANHSQMLRGEVINGTNPADATCDCDLESKGIMANILHKKCPIIALAQMQLQKVTDETDRIYFYNNKCYRSFFEGLYSCKDLVCCENKRIYKNLFCAGFLFFIGVLFGAASCGIHSRRFNSPVFACIDRLFAYDVNFKDASNYSIY